MMWILWPLLVAAPTVPTVHQAFERMAAQPLWPGFDARTIPVAVYDGKDTWLFGHPHPPAGFRGEPLRFTGRHDAIRANTGTDLAGVPTATADLSASRAGTNERAALLIHEAFHVYARKAHPRWSANEADLFTYPVEDAEALALRRLETRSLVRALAATDSAKAWALSALAARSRRFERLPREAAAYERGTELNEGLAQYVERRALAAPAALRADDFAPEAVRERGYASGEAFAQLLDRLAPGWQAKFDTTSLDETLRLELGSDPRAAWTSRDSLAEHARARTDIARLRAALARRREEFLAAPGDRIEIVAGAEPLWPQAFDPLNVARLDSSTVLHTRWIKLGNGKGSIEVLGRPALTEAAGAHPLFQGVRRVIVTGLASPSLGDSAGTVTVRAEGVHGTLVGTIERRSGSALIRLR